MKNLKKTETETQRKKSIAIISGLCVNFKFIISNNFKNQITYKVFNKKVYI